MAITGKAIVIDFLYLDLTVCDRCQGTEASLAKALEQVGGLLQAAGATVQVNTINVVNEEQAQRLAFASSPTIRVNGRDIQLEVKESNCDSCGDLCGSTVDCRVWLHEGQEYVVPPPEMIAEAIIWALEDNQEPPILHVDFEVPENLQRFFSELRQKEHIKCSCCGD